MASEIVSLGNQTGEGWFLTGEMLELIHSGAGNIVCTQPFACLPIHVVGKGVIKELRRRHPESNIVAIDFDPGASEVNQLNRIKLMLSTAFKNMEKEKNNHVWGFDIGKGSLGEAVRIGGDFKHIASVLLDPEFGEIKTAALARRQMRTRKAHKAREKWLEECLEGTGVEILKRREVGIVDGQWQLISKGDERLEREFPPSGEDVCYNSIALRCKLLLGEKLEGWHVFKALYSAIQKRGYDENIPWGEAEENSSKKDDDDYAQKLSQYEKEKSELFESFAAGEKYDYPCFFKAY